MAWSVKQLAAFTRGADVQVEKRAIEHDGFMRLETLTLRHRLFAGGFSGAMQREILCRTPAVGVLIWDPQRAEVLLVEQFRVGALADERSPWCLEVVAGIADQQGEPFAELIEREAKEEANIALRELLPLPAYFVSPGGTNERMHLFLGIADLTHAGGVHGLAAEHEDIRSHCIPTAQLPMLLAEGYLNNAASLIAVQWFLLHQTELQQNYA